MMKKMNKKILTPAIVGIFSIIVIFSLYFSNENDLFHVSKMNLSYDFSNSKIQSMLEKNGIAMSTPLKIKGDSIDEYCKFFSDDALQNSIQYCTSTELIDSNGHFVGNIHMVGDLNSPFAVLGVMQTDPFMSELGSVKSVSESMVESLVCDCWAEKKPGSFKSVSEWLDTVKSYHLQAKKITSKSEINGLAQRQLLVEITTNTEGYLWKFIVTN